MHKKIAFALFTLLLLFALAFSLTGCVDKSKPWRDDAGHLHDKYVCHMDPYTVYTTVKHGDTTIQVPHTVYQRVCEYV